MGSFRDIMEIISWFPLVSWNSSTMRYLQRILSRVSESLYRTAKAKTEASPKVRRSSAHDLRMNSK